MIQLPNEIIRNVLKIKWKTFKEEFKKELTKCVIPLYILHFGYHTVYDYRKIKVVTGGTEFPFHLVKWIKNVIITDRNWCEEHDVEWVGSKLSRITSREGTDHYYVNNWKSRQVNNY